MFEYELDGEVLQFTQEDVDNRAKEKGLTTEDYLAQHPEVKPVSVKKTNDVAEPGAAVASETPAPDVSASSSEATSLVSPKFKYDPEAFLKQSETVDIPVKTNTFSVVNDKIVEQEDPFPLVTKAEEEEKRQDNFIKKQAEQNFKDFKVANKDLTKISQFEEGFTTTIDYGNKESVEAMNNTLSFEFFRKNEDYKNLVSAIEENNKDALLDKQLEIISKYKADPKTGMLSEEDYESANNEYNDFFNSIILKNPRVNKMFSAYMDKVNDLHQTDENRYVVSENTPPWIKALQLQSEAGLSAKIPYFTAYNSVNRLLTGAKSAALATVTDKIYAPTYKHYDAITKQAKNEGWTEETEGYVNPDNGFFSTKLGPASGYRNKTTWGKAKAELDSKINKHQENYKDKLNDVLSDREVQSAYQKADFVKMASGENSLGNLKMMVADQVPMMIGALVSYGTIPAISESASVYETLIQQEARKLYPNFDNIEDKDEKAKILYEVAMKDDGSLYDKAASAGIIMGQLERVGAKAALFPMLQKTSESLVRGQYKNFLKNTVKGTVSGSFSESLTEGLQTFTSSAFTGEFSGKEFVEAIGMGGTIGAVMPFSGSVLRQSTRELTSANRLVMGKLDSKSTERFFNNQLLQLDRAFKKGEISKEDYDAKVEAVSNLKNNNTKIPRNFSQENKEKSLDILTKKQELEKEKENLDPNLTDEIDEQIKVENEKLKEISKQEAELVQAKKKGVTVGELRQEQFDEYFETTTEMAQDIKDKTGRDVIIEEGVNTTMAELLVDSGEFSTIEEAMENVDGTKGFRHGAIGVDENGNTFVLLNKESSIATGKVTTAAHEFLHAVLFQTLKRNTDAQMEFGSQIINALNEEGGVDPNSDFAKRLSTYTKEEGLGEEVATLLSESMLLGDVKFNEGVFTKIKDAFRRFMLKYTNKEFTFDKSKDFYNFLKDYNASLTDEKLRGKIINVATKGAKGKLITPVKDVEADVETMASKEASDKVQQVYEQQGEAGLFDILEAFKPITTRIARRFRDVPGYDEQLVIDEIETGKRGIFDLIREYKPESGVPLAAYINKFLPARSIEAGNRILKTEFEADVTEARGVAAEETVEQQPERRLKAKVLADELNIADKVASEVAEANVDKTKLNNFKSVPNAATNTVGELLSISPAKIKSKANLTAAEVANAQRWFNKNAQLVIDALPQGFDVEGQATGVPRTVLQALYTQKETRAKTAAGLKGQVKRTNIKDSEFLALVDIVDGKPTRNRNTSARIIALADLLGKTITNQELRKTDPSLARIRSGMSDVMFSKAEGAKTFNMVEKPSDVQIPLVSIQLLKDLLEGKTRTGFRDMDAEFEPGITFDQKASEIANNFLNQSPEVKSLVENTMTGGVRGGLFLTKPEFNKRIKTKEVKDVSEKLKSYRYNYNSEKRLTKKAVESFNDKDVADDRNARLDILHNFWKDVETYLKDNPQDQWFFEALVRDTSRGQQALTRVLAPFRGYAVDNNGKPVYNLEVVEEHSKPQNNISYAYLNAAVEGKVDELKPVVEASYMQISLLKTDDKAIAAAGLEQTMPDIYFDVIVPKIKSGELKLAPGMAAAVRLAAVGTPYAPKVSDNVIDLNKIYMPELDQTIAQHFGIDKIKDTKAANILLIEELAGINFENTKLPEAQLSKAMSNARPVMQYSKESRGMSTFDFDETLIIEGENFIVATKGDDVQRISSGDWPLLGPTLADEGYSFDFTDFVNVRGGVDGPLLQKMKNQIKKYGTQNVFVLTARPAESATAIHEWLKTKGINIPFENITGLGNSTGDAKAAWFLDKYAEGYNDMYFVDDAMPNVDAVKHVFDQLDIKGKSVQAKVQFSKGLSTEFNKMLERTKGVGAEKIFSRIGAQKRGKNVGRFTFFVPPSADDFAGLLRYFVGKGEQGNRDLDFFNRALIKPFARADRDMKEARQSILDDHKTLRKEMPQVVKKLGKMIDDSGFTFDNAIRVYLWDKAGFDIPGLSKRDIAFLTNRVKTDQDLKTYADVVGQISKQKEGYIEPSEYWNVESIAADLQNVVNKQGRKKFLAEWKENVDVIFSPENLNKIEAAYGSNFREALENILWRMENGTNRAKGMGRLEGAWNNWVNNSVGAIMFFNARSAVLQTLSTVNFINFEDNNIFAAAKAFGNQKQYWKDFSFLFNSDFLKQRRAGLQTNINEAEIASAVAGTANKAKAALQYILKQGFLPTQIADSFAIASGGATYYRNRVKKYVKQGLSQTEAEAQAMEDFMEIAEETQQSARPDRISQQQASSLGRIILAFANTPMQYARLIKKAAGDLVKGRGDWRSNVSRIIYYGAIQNIIFSSLQSAIFALAFDDEEPEQDEIDTKVQRTLNGMIDSLLRGSGLAGAVVSTLKNVINRFIQESEKKSRADYGNVLVDALNVSPPIGSKSRKLYNATKTYKYNREVMGEMNTFDLENPIWDAVGNVVSATTNLPLDRGFRKIDNMKEALNQDNETWQRIAVGLGWDQWSLGIDSRKEVQEARELIKEKKKEEKKKSQQRCTKIKSDGTRCKIMVNKPKTRCHYHD